MPFGSLSTAPVGPWQAPQDGLGRLIAMSPQPQPPAGTQTFIACSRGEGLPGGPPLTTAVGGTAPSCFYSACMSTAASPSPGVCCQTGTGYMWAQQGAWGSATSVPSQTLAAPSYAAAFAKPNAPVLLPSPMPPATLAASGPSFYLVRPSKGIQPRELEPRPNLTPCTRQQRTQQPCLAQQHQVVPRGEAAAARPDEELLEDDPDVPWHAANGNGAWDTLEEGDEAINDEEDCYEEGYSEDDGSWESGNVDEELPEDEYVPPPPPPPPKRNTSKAKQRGTAQAQQRSAAAATPGPSPFASVCPTPFRTDVFRERLGPAYVSRRNAALARTRGVGQETATDDGEDEDLEEDSESDFTPRVGDVASLAAPPTQAIGTQQPGRQQQQPKQQQQPQQQLQQQLQPAPAAATRSSIGMGPTSRNCNGGDSGTINYVRLGGGDDHSGCATYEVVQTTRIVAPSWRAREAASTSSSSSMGSGGIGTSVGERQGNNGSGGGIGMAGRRDCNVVNRGGGNDIGDNNTGRGSNVSGRSPCDDFEQPLPCPADCPGRGGATATATATASASASATATACAADDPMARLRQDMSASVWSGGGWIHGLGKIAWHGTLVRCHRYSTWGASRGCGVDLSSHLLTDLVLRLPQVGAS